MQPEKTNPNASIVPTFTVMVNGKEHTVTPRQADIARVETLFKTSISRLSQESEFGLLLAFAFVCLRRMKVEGIPSSYDDFLDIDPEIDLESMQEEVSGKDSDPAATTG